MPPETTVRLDFEHRYELAVLDSIDRRIGTRLHFPGAIEEQSKTSSGVILRVQPDGGAPWLGVFELGSHGGPPEVGRRVVGWPDGRSFCVVDRGSGCLVRADDPYSEQAIYCNPIRDVVVVPGRGLVLFADATTLIAYDAVGIAWQSERLCWDELRVLDVEGDAVHAAGYDPTGSAARTRFTVDLATGVSHDAPYRAG